MKHIKLLTIMSILIIALNGCFKTEVSDEVASKLPVCVETSKDMYTMSQGNIAEVGNYFKQSAGEEAYKMYPIENGKQLIFKIKKETIILDTKYQELEKGACMEIIRVHAKDKNGQKALEASSSNPEDYRNLVKVAEYIFKF